MKYLELNLGYAIELSKVKSEKDTETLKNEISQVTALMESYIYFLTDVKVALGQLAAEFRLLRDAVKCHIFINNKYLYN